MFRKKINQTFKETSTGADSEKKSKNESFCVERNHFRGKTYFSWKIHGTHTKRHVFLYYFPTSGLGWVPRVY